MKKVLLSLMAVLMMGTALLAQGDQKYGSTEEQQLKCKEALSVYRGFRDQGNDKDAYPAWRNACTVCPPTVTQRLYSDGVKFIKHQLMNTQSKERKAVLIDSIFTLYDMRMEYYPATKNDPNNKCTILGFKANDLSNLKPSMIDSALVMYEESIQCLGVETKASAVSGYYQLLYKKLISTEGEEQFEVKTRMYRGYLELMDICNSQIQNTEGKEKDGYVKAKNNLDELFIPIASCEDMVPLLQKRYDAAPTDPIALERILKLLTLKECTDSDLFLKVAVTVDENAPTAESAYAIGIKYLKDKENGKSLEYLRKAVERCEDCPDFEKYVLKAGQVASVNGNTAEANSFARKLLNVNPNSGEAYILIGDAIRGNAQACDDGALGARSVYWLAADYYQKAKKMDSAVSEEANKKIRACEGQYPTREQLFSFSKQEGDQFTVPCMGETTTVRERK